jgi:hypothetical protein
MGHGSAIMGVPDEVERARARGVMTEEPSAVARSLLCF